MSSRAVPLSTETRGQPRHKVFLPAEMTGVDGPRRVHLLNLSPSGALIHGDAPLRAGSVVQLSCRESSWLARVVWTQQKRFGVVHVPPLGTETIDRLVAR